MFKKVVYLKRKYIYELTVFSPCGSFSPLHQIHVKDSFKCELVPLLNERKYVLCSCSIVFFNIFTTIYCNFFLCIA